VLVGWLRDADTSQLLFGYRTAHRNWGCPVGLAALELVSDGLIPACEETLRARTRLGAFLPLMPQPRRAELVALCRSTVDTCKAQAKAALGRYGESYGMLKFCHACVRQQLKDRGFTYWDASHQWPGVWVCPKHMKVLAYFVAPTPKCTYWLLPHQVGSLAKEVPAQVSDVLQLLRVQAVISWIARQPSIDTNPLLTMLKLRLRVAGYLRSELKVSTTELAHIDVHGRARYATAFFPDIVKLNAREWLPTLFSEERHYNPLSWAAALALHGACDDDKLTLDYKDAVARVPQRDLFDHARDGPHCSAAPRLLYEAFSTAVLKRDVVERTQLSAWEVDNWLRRDPRLGAHWRECHAQRRRAESWAEITTFMRDHPRCCRVDVLRRCARAYRWLETHDRAALRRALPEVLQKYSRQLLLDLGAEHHPAEQAARG
jgi:hypothetical protein